MSTLSRKIQTIAASSMLALSAGTVSDAFAGEIFTVDPTTYFAGGSVFDADFISGSSTARVTTSDFITYASTGFVAYNGYSLASAPISAFDTGVGAYGIYGSFSQTFTCPAALSPGVECTVSSIDLDLYIDPDFDDNVYTQATLATVPVVTDTSGDDVLLGTANVVFSGLAGLNALGGAYENVNTNFILTAAGSAYFIDPVPFYNLAFSTFNNTSTGITCNTPGCASPTIVAIVSEVGGTDLHSVPEPATLALLGMGILAAGFSSRRKV